MQSCPHRPFARRLGQLQLVAVACMAIGCSADDPKPGAADAATGEEADGGDTRGSTGAHTCTDRAGGFRLIDDERDGASLDGRVYARPPLSASEEAAVRHEQACTVYRLLPCGDCGCDDIRCPERRDVGTVTVTGLGEPLSIEPSSFVGPPPYTAVLERSDPSSEEGSAIVLEASGGDYAPFELHVNGVGQLVAPEQDIVVEADRPVLIEWDPPRSGSDLRMAIELRISELSWIECEAPDTGAFEISSTLITALLNRSPSLTNGLTLTRFSADATEIEPGCVDFVVASRVSLPITIPSLISCLDGAPCPEGKLCQGNFVCR